MSFKIPNGRKCNLKSFKGQFTVGDTQSLCGTHPLWHPEIVVFHVGEKTSGLKLSCLFDPRILLQPRSAKHAHDRGLSQDRAPISLIFESAF